MKKSHGDGSGGQRRQPMRSSHERVLEGSGRKSKSKAPRRTLRVLPDDASRDAGVIIRARQPKKAKAPAAPQRDSGGPWSVASEAARERATAIAIAALDKKAVGVEILDVAGKVDYADFLVIMTGRSDRHTQALAQGIEDALKKKGVRPMAVEGLPHGSWVLMDFGDVVVHVFQDETRQLYDIEGLWLDARRLPVPAGVSVPE